MERTTPGDHQKVFLREANILRKNLEEWDRTLRSSRGEDWPAMLGRLNAAMSQVGNLDRGIDDVLEHFVYEPKKCTANPQDIPTFLSTRLVESGNTGGGIQVENCDIAGIESGCSSNEIENQAVVLREYEDRASEFVNEFKKMAGESPF